MGVTEKISLSIAIISFGFAIYQWRSNIKAKNLHTQNLRRLWDMSRSYAPYRVTTNKLINQTDNKEIISSIERSHVCFATIFREITPLYIQEIKHKLNYNFVKAMIENGEIGSSWTLRLVLMEFPPKKREIDTENECYQLLVESKKKLNAIKNEINKATIELKNDRNKLTDKEE